MKQFTCGFIAVLTFSGATNSLAQPVFSSGTFILHLVAKPARKETYSLTPTSSGLRLKSHFEYSDRGAPVPLDFTFDGDSELRPIALAITGKSTRFSASARNHHSSIRYRNRRTQSKNKRRHSAATFLR